MKKLERKTAAFSNPPKGREARDVHWLKPELVGEVEFTEWTNERLLRHPAFKGLRKDKPAKQVMRETSGQSNQQKEGSKMKENKNADTIAGIRLSNPDRILYPEQEITKRALAEFYRDMADWILPHIVERPLSIVRCPRGREQKCFYQKHVTDSIPDAISGVEIREKEGKGTYLMIKDLQGLISLAQMGVLEIHPWGSRSDKVGNPDILTFDLDPGEGVGYEEVVDAARLLHKRFNEIGLQSFVKTSGGKGLHVVVPISRRSGWEEAKAFTNAIAQDVAKREPKKFIATMSKAKRRGKIFIDYLRNSRGATSVATYSTRARRGAPVSTPLSWDELSPDLKPNAYNIENVRRRLASLKSDPWEGFFDIRQSITAAMKNQFGL